MKRFFILLFCFFIVVGFFSCKDDVAGKTENVQNSENIQNSENKEYIISASDYNTKVDKNQWQDSFEYLVSIRDNINLSSENGSEGGKKNAVNFVSKGFTDAKLLPKERDSLNSETGFKLFVNKINKDQNFFCLVAPEWDIMYSPDLRKPILPGKSTSIVLARLDKDDSKFYLTTFNPSTDNPSTGSWDWFREEENESFYNYMVTLFNNLGDEYSNAYFKDGKYTITLENTVYVVGFNSESKLGYIKTSDEEIEITYPASVSFEETVPKITRFNKI